MTLNLAELSVMVVEDHEFQRVVAEQALKGLGIKNLRLANNGSDALKQLENSPVIDIVICDLDMPEMDGIQFIRHLADEGYARAVIVASALAPSLIRTVEDMAQEHGLRVLGALPKPLSRDRVRELLKLYSVRTRPSNTVSHLHFTEEDLQKALDDDQFILHYQPKVLVRSGRLVSMEALCRWPHPEIGMVSPAHFIPLMESTGLIHQLTGRLVSQTLKQLRSDLDHGRAISIGVNLSPVVLTDTALPDDIYKKTRALNINPELLTLEITESTLIENAAKALETLARLKMKGFSLSIDDFGTGYSSMQQLNRIPFSELKIDQSFVQSANTDKTRKAIIEANINLAHTLEMETVAEGVETLEEWHLLDQLHCDMAQGFLIGKPMPAEELPEWEKQWTDKLPLPLPPDKPPAK
ncbi:EAL domain-containing protein [Endozoicomonas montiporae]|uniref:Response regulator n=1 Tax=Endozoicomonas montiporae CL-33 TaxID=570277 RepID=A0A142BHZ1_9GAMM|nr:EAL domain-containing response regulator [Endozoicomonas montiporae]AMO58367.1 response regulator [Endozoicomonas montiporae CL-33]